MDLLRVFFDKSTGAFVISISPWLVAAAGAFVVAGICLRRRFKHYRMVKLNIKLGGIGTVEVAPNNEDIQIAHQLWTELITRKAAIPIDPSHDVIVEVYDSWYALFTKTRELIAQLPAELVRREASTREVVRISTATLNDGLRPHLTRWQARFRNWWATNETRLQDTCPQDLQREFPEYDELITDMLEVNDQLISYAAELKKLRDG